MADQTPPFKSANSSLTYEIDPSESSSVAVVEAVAAVSDREPTKMVPLYETIDTDALDALLADRREFGNGNGVRISFAYESHEVTVTSNGRVLVKPLHGA